MTVTLLMNVKEGLAEEFVSGLPALIRETSSSPGARSVPSFRNGESANAILSIEEWESEEAFRKYITWRTERGDMERLGQMMSLPPEIATWSTATRALS
jgi:quinol monooxygenase YgiN